MLILELQDRAAFAEAEIVNRQREVVSLKKLVSRGGDEKAANR